MEDRQEALGDQVVDLALVRLHLRQVVRGLGGDDRVVVLDLGVVHHAPERQILQPGDVCRSLRVLGIAPDELGGGADLGDHVAREPARVRARVGDRLVLLVELLGRAQGPLGGEAEPRVGLALERGEVVQELRAFALLLLLELRDLAPLIAAVLHDRGRELLVDPLAAEVAARVEALGVRREVGLDQPVRLGLECADLLLPPRDERERRRLHPSQRHDAVERRPQPDRRCARRVHADQPVRLRARARGCFERLHLLAGAQVLERVGRSPSSSSS